jgi:hypothetical protein
MVAVEHDLLLDELAENMKILGFKCRTFFVVLAIILIIITVEVGGGVGGTLGSSLKSNSLLPDDTVVTLTLDTLTP